MVLTINFITLTILLLHKHVASNPVSITSAQKNLRGRRPASESPTQCTLFSIHYMSLSVEPELESSFRCVTDDGRSKTIINVPEEFSNTEKFESGKTQVSVVASGTGKRVSDLEADIVSRYDVIDMATGSGMIVTDISSRRTKSSFSRDRDFSILVVRVSDTYHHSPNATVAQISDSIFGTAGAPLNLAVGYQACSGNNVNFRPATGPRFAGGVMDLVLRLNITNWSSLDVENKVTRRLENNGFNPHMYTNVMYVFPEEVNFGNKISYAYGNGRLSVIKNNYVSKQYVLMHVIGRNFGHHGSGGEGYHHGDTTGMMGTQSMEDGMPRACFNAAKSWWFGWYSDRHTEVTPTSGSVILKMLSIDDYLTGQATSDDQYTVARISGTNEVDLYVMYNRAEGINYQVAGHRDQVTIVRQNGPNRASWLEAGLGFETDVSSQWIKSNWDGRGRNLVVQICEKVAGTPDYARVIVYLQGLNDVSCGEINPSTCASGKSNFKAEILTDNNGSETAWWLKEKSAEGLFDSVILRDGHFRDNLHSEKEKCIDSSKCYKFKIRDDGRDGICCGESGNGSYQIKFDDETIRDSPFKDLRYEATIFGECN